MMVWKVLRRGHRTFLQDGRNRKVDAEVAVTTFRAGTRCVDQAEGVMEGGRMPRFLALATAWVRVLTPSLA